MDPETVPKRSSRVRKAKNLTDYPQSRQERSRWSIEEKTKLLNALKKYGYENVGKIAIEIGTKTETDVLLAIRYWRRLAVNVNSRSINIAKIHARRYSHLQQRKDTTKNQQRLESLLCIESWIKFFQSKLKDTSESEGAYCFSNIFLTIAKFEAHPDPKDADGLDFQELYLWLNDLINGKPMKKLPGHMMLFILNSFEELSNVSRNSELRSLLSHVNRMIEHSWTPKNVKKYGRNIKLEESEETACSNMRELIKLGDINPIELPADSGIRKTLNMCQDIK